MSRITATNLSVQLPIYNYHSLSLKKSSLRIGSRGRIHATAKAVIVDALQNLNFNVEDGDRIGLIGANGSGKTTLLRTLAGVFAPTGGTLAIEGKTVPMLVTDAGIHEDASGYENIRSIAMQMGMSPQQIEERMPEIAAFTELGEYLALPVFSYSTGMRTRLGFAVATTIEADILLLDEVIGTGDLAFMQKARQRFQRFIERARILVIASHNDAWIRETCTKAMLLKDGRLLAFGPAAEVVDQYHQMAAMQ
jgi:ABC-type polysaccharide/polyol phosphate transport system ATPase subunit